MLQMKRSINKAYIYLFGECVPRALAILASGPQTKSVVTAQP